MDSWHRIMIMEHDVGSWGVRTGALGIGVWRQELSTALGFEVRASRKGCTVLGAGVKLDVELES